VSDTFTVLTIVSTKSTLCATAFAAVHSNNLSADESWCAANLVMRRFSAWAWSYSGEVAAVSTLTLQPT
jgi:hypothetical protein